MAEPTIVLSRHLIDFNPHVIEFAYQHLPAGFKLEPVAPSEVERAAVDADYVVGVVVELGDEALASASRLRLIQLMSAGYDGVNIEGARRAGIPIATNGGANSVAVAEHAITLMLCTLKNIPAMDAQVRTGAWRSGPATTRRIDELTGATVGIIGMGRIGQVVARYLRAWDTALLYYSRRRLDPDREAQLGARFVSMDELLAASDVVSLNVSMTDETRRLIDARALSLMKPTAILINTTRGGVVDELALIEALRAGRIGGAGLDVLDTEPPLPDNPLYGMPNVVLTPHMGGPTWQSWPRRFANCFANVARVQRGEAPEWVIPELADLVTGSSSSPWGRGAP